MSVAVDRHHPAWHGPDVRAAASYRAVVAAAIEPVRRLS
jgi:hypothetical protein